MSRPMSVISRPMRLDFRRFLSIRPPKKFALNTSPESNFESFPPNLREKLERLKSRQLYLVWDQFGPENAVLLNLTLGDFLPKAPKTRDRAYNILQPGFHLVYFSPHTTTGSLYPDGTDGLHAPGGPWTQRLWAGGRLHFPKRQPVLLHGRKAVLMETIKSVEARGPPGSEKIFVEIERIIGPHSNERQGLPETRSHLERLAHNGGRGAFVVEQRELCFLREPSNGASSALNRPRPPIPPPSDPDFSHSLTPTPALLFRYSALTFNAHAIHIDPEYTRKTYGLPNLVVHGPLALTLMLECMRRALYNWAKERNETSRVIVDIDYKNLAPLFVNEEITICCKNLSPTSLKDNHLNMKGKLKEEFWSVWVQKAQGDRQTVAVRGTVRVAPFDQEAHQAKGIRKLVGDGEAAEAESDDEHLGRNVVNNPESEEEKSSPENPQEKQYY